MAGRGDLPFARLHGEPLLAHALRGALAALRAPGRPGGPDGRAPSGNGTQDVEVAVVVDDDSRERSAAVTRSLDFDRFPVLHVEEWWQRRERAELLHDALCPLAPASLLREVAARRLTATGPAVAAYRPVTDTVKTAREDRIEGTIDRDRLGIVVAPVLIPRGVGAGEQAPPLDLARLVDWLRERTTVELVRSPSLARRVHDLGSVALLECVDEMARRTR